MKSRIPELIKKNNENITQLSEELNLSRTLISKLSNSIDLPDNTKISTLIKLANHFNLDIYDLFYYYADSLNIEVDKSVNSRGISEITREHFAKLEEPGSNLYEESKILLFKCLINGQIKKILLFSSIYVGNDTVEKGESNPFILLNYSLPNKLDLKILKAVAPDIYKLIDKNQLLSNYTLSNNLELLKQTFDFILDNSIYGFDVSKFENNSNDFIEMGAYQGDYTLLNANLRVINGKLDIEHYNKIYDGSLDKPDESSLNSVISELVELRSTSPKK